MKLAKNLSVRLVLIFALAGLLLTSCAAPTPAPVPTMDPATLVAQAVQTLSMAQTQEAALNPSATPTATATIPPTFTPAPPTLTPTATIVPTATNTLPPPLSAKFNYATTYPEYKSEYVPNERFSLAIGFSNNGTIAWDPGSKLKLVSFQGEVTVQPEVELGQRIEPGSKVEFNLWAYGSETLGKHVWVFQLYNSQGVPVPGGSVAFTYTSK